MEESKKNCYPSGFPWKDFALERYVGKNTLLILHIKYYTGGDLALMELYPEAYSQIDGKVIPACLPNPGNDEDPDNIEQGEF